MPTLSKELLVLRQAQKRMKMELCILDRCKSSTYMSLEDADYLILQNILFDMDSLTFYPNKESDIHLIQCTYSSMF